MPSLRSALLAAALLLVGAGIGSAIALSQAGKSHLSASAPARFPAARGWTFDRRVPPLRLTSAGGRALSLDALRGKAVALAPALTLCHEVCPMTTQALMLVRRRLAEQGLVGRVVLAEATVDPWRDSPARLRAYERLTGAHLLQLTGSVAQMRGFWDFFGIGFRRVPQRSPPDTDWWTGRPETFDVQHTDGLFLIDQQGYERRFFAGPANVGGRLSPALRRLLSGEGLRGLAHAEEGWTPLEVANAIEGLLGVHTRP